MITREFPPVGGGIGSYVQNLSKALIKKNHRVSVITRGSPRKLRKRTVDNIDVYEATFLPLYPIHLELHKLFINQLLGFIKPDLVHLHSPVTPSISTNCPVVTTVHTAMKTDARYHEVVNAHSLAERVQSMYFSPLAESALLRRSNIITAVSPSVATELKAYGVNPDKVEVVWNGVDEKTFSPASTIGKREKYVLYSGRLWARKGLFDLINSAKIIKREIPDIKFHVCGAGPLLQELKAQVRRLELDEQVQFLGRVNRRTLLYTYQNATMQVVPSIYEGLPTVLLEGMSCGLPIIASNIGGNRDIIQDCYNGLLVPARSPISIAGAITRLWTNEGLRGRLGKNARETVLKKFTWNTISDNYLKIYNQALTEAVEKPLSRVE